MSGAGLIRKAQPTLSQVHVAAPLTNIAVAYMQDDNSYIADKVFPIVPVEFQSDLYYKWSKDDFFRDEAQQRADGQESAGSGLNLTTDSYSAKVWALHKDIGDQMRRNADPAVDIEVAVTRALMQKLLIRRDRLFATQYLATSIWGTDITGSATPSGAQVYQWSDGANSDPFSDIADGQTKVLQNTGQEANVLTLGFPTYQALRKHPLVIDRIKYTMQADAKSITPELMAAAFDIDRVVVAKATYNSSNEGASSPSYSFAVGKVALLCHSAPAPGLMVPSAGYIFGWAGLEGNNSEGISAWSEPVPNRGRPGSTVRCEAEMAFDMKVVGSDLGYFFTSIVA
jgi:hypothetical protein